MKDCYVRIKTLQKLRDCFQFAKYKLGLVYGDLQANSTVIEFTMSQCGKGGTVC